MKVLLINPPNNYELVANDPIMIKEQQGVSPPLGILYLGAYLRSTRRYEVSVIDAQVDNLTYANIAMMVDSIKPDVIGMTVMTFTLIDVKKTIEWIRTVTTAPIVLGGPHPTIYPEETMESLKPDYVICGEGEITLAMLLQAIPSDRKIWYSDSFIEDLDCLPFPARDLTPYRKYYSVLAKETPTTTMFSSRGCPFKCTYCDRPALGKRFRAMSAIRTVDEMEHCVKMGIKEIFFYDDTFTVSKKRVMEICEEILRRNLKITWDIRARVNTVDEDMIPIMKRAGCERIHFGVESAQDHILKNLNKGITRDQVLKAFSLCKKYRIKSLAYFMIGNPGESISDIWETLKFAKRLRPDYMQCTILTPFPSTKLYRDALDSGLIKTDVWREYSVHPLLSFKPPVWSENFSRSELQNILRKFYRGFYLRPSFIIGAVSEIRNREQLVRYFKAGLSLLKMSVK
jgi:anaerobic magnesium-protoporphyrin IX monomethyl ester cyclase